MVLSKRAQALWAKKENHDGQELWLPLIAHLIDTDNVIDWLYKVWLNDAQREQLRGDMSETETRKLVRVIGGVHDIGKATPSFQTKKSYNRDKELDDELIEGLMRQGFSALNEYDPTDHRESPHAIAGESLLEDSGLNESVGAIIGAHHGKPADQYFDYSFDQLSVYPSNYFQSDDEDELKATWEQVQQELINYELKRAGYQSLEDIPEITQQQAVLLTGLLIMADWIASSEYFNDDPTRIMFPLIPLDQTMDDLNMETRFQKAIMTWDISNHWEPQPIFDINEHYQKRWGFHPRTVQRLMSEEIGKIVDPGMVIIEATMGIGKTEIAMTAVEQLSLATGSSGMFMGLPTQATTNAMFSRAEKWVDELAEESTAKLPIKLMHGKAQFNKENRSLPLATDISDHGSAVINSWFSGKKSMLADFDIGTIDHLLLMSLKQRHLFLRHLGLSGKVVVIDEIHAYDSYMNSYLKCTLQWLGAYHIPVIALSATLPKKKRKELLEAYYKGKFGHNIKGQTKWADSQAYPLLTYLDGEEVKQFDQFSAPDHQQENKVIRLSCDDETLVTKVLESIKEGGIAGIVVNTVKRAQQISRLIPKNIEKLILHSAFLATDREELEEQLQKTIGKNGDRPERMVVVGTQVLEQSLDIDFDVLFTDIAPMDLLLQRMGRLHRHQIKRPAKLKEPTTYVLGINALGDYGDANEAVYDKYWLMKTDHFLPDTINIPNDISKLVQKVYDSRSDSEILGIEEPRHEENVFERKEIRKAGEYQIEEPDQYDNLHGWLDRDHEDMRDANVEAAVRDIKESIELVLLQHTDDGDFLLDGRRLDEVNDEEIAKQIIRLPNAITPDISAAINKLEKITDAHYRNWQDSYWLKGTLALVLDGNLKTQFNGYQICYSKRLGLIYEKEE